MPDTFERLELEIEKQSLGRAVRLLVWTIEGRSRSILDIMVFEAELQCDTATSDLWQIFDPPRVGERRRYFVPICCQSARNIAP